MDNELDTLDSNVLKWDTDIRLLEGWLEKPGLYQFHGNYILLLDRARRGKAIALRRLALCLQKKIREARTQKKRH